jgi:hypothetical protein
MVLISFGISGLMLVYSHSERVFVYLCAMMLMVGVGAAYQAWRLSR